MNIGVGGSNLGPQMVTEALRNHANKKMNLHYVSNVDSTQISNVLNHLNPETVLFIVSSKTYTTTETIINAKSNSKPHATDNAIWTQGGALKEENET